MIASDVKKLKELEGENRRLNEYMLILVYRING
jgi:hypothetical protein